MDFYGSKGNNMKIEDVRYDIPYIATTTTIPF